MLHSETLSPKNKNKEKMIDEACAEWGYEDFHFFITYLHLKLILYFKYYAFIFINLLMELTKI